MKLHQRAILLLSVLLTPMAFAGDSVREVVARGDAVSYEALEKAVRQQFYGRMIRVELDEKNGRWYYEIRLLQDDGRIIEVELEANNLTIIEVEGHQLETVIRRKQ